MKKFTTLFAIVGVILTIALFTNAAAQQRRMIENEVARARFGTWATIR